MIRDVVTNGREDYSFFFVCDCQFELVQFYYYKSCNYHPNIIGLKYFGHVDNKINSTDKTIQFTEALFEDFIAFVSLEKGGEFELRDDMQILKAYRDSSRYIHLERWTKRKKEAVLLWDIVFSDSMRDELLEHLKTLFAEVRKIS